MEPNKQNTQQLIDGAYQSAELAIDKVKKNVDLKISNYQNSQEKDQIDAILDKINSEF